MVLGLFLNFWTDVLFRILYIEKKCKHLKEGEYKII